MISGFPRLVFCLAKHVGSGHWAVQKRYGSVFDPFSVRFRFALGPLRSIGFVSNRFCSKLCFLPRRGAWFCKTTFTTLHQNFTIVDPQLALINDTFVPVALSCRPLVPSESHFCPFCRTPEFVKFFGKMCLFCLGPLM